MLAFSILTSDEFGVSWILIKIPCCSATSLATSANSFISEVFIITSSGIPWAILIHLRHEEQSKTVVRLCKESNTGGGKNTWHITILLIIPFIYSALNDTQRHFYKLKYHKGNRRLLSILQSCIPNNTYMFVSQLWIIADSNSACKITF